MTVSNRCVHLPTPGTIVVEKTAELAVNTLANNLDPTQWPRVAVCRLCGEWIRLERLVLADWELFSDPQP